LACFPANESKTLCLV